MCSPTTAVVLGEHSHSTVWLKCTRALLTPMTMQTLVAAGYEGGNWETRGLDVPLSMEAKERGKFLPFLGLKWDE